MSALAIPKTWMTLATSSLRNALVWWLSHPPPLRGGHQALGGKTKMRQPDPAFRPCDLSNAIAQTEHERLRVARRHLEAARLIIEGVAREHSLPMEINDLPFLESYFDPTENY
jgi:hypothetical protein